MKEEKILDMLPESVHITGSLEDYYVELDGEYLDPALSQKVLYKSEDLSWGYGGSGPAQMALAILLEYLPVKYALKYYQNLKWNFIATIPRANFDVHVNLRELIQKTMHVTLFNKDDY